MPISVLLRIACGVTVISLTAPLLAAHKFSDYPARTAAECAIKVVRGGVTIGIEPVSDRGQQKIYFNADLAKAGYIPVYLAIQNGSATDSFLFDKSDVGFAGASNNSSPKAGDRKVASHVQENLLNQEIKSSTISPGASIHGFLYIPVPKSDTPKGKTRIQIPLTKGGTSEIYVFNLFF